MSQDRLSSDAALRKMRQEYAVSCQNLVVELEQVTVGLSYFDRPSEESDIKEKLQEIIQDLKDNSSSKISIKKVDSVGRWNVGEIATLLTRPDGVNFMFS